jgi:hypothetical protein
MIFIFGNDVAASDDFGEIDQPVEGCIGHEASNQTIRSLKRDVWLAGD